MMDQVTLERHTKMHTSMLHYMVNARVCCQLNKKKKIKIFGKSGFIFTKFE